MNGNQIENLSIRFLKWSFAIGAIADFAVGVNWLLITIGYDIPNFISSFSGSGTDYRFAMYISTMFMFGWTAIMIWGFLKPLERSGLLMITVALLALSIVIELIFYYDLLASVEFLSGIIFRILIIAKFTFAYLFAYGREKSDRPS
jgi:hypothetical protein